MKAKSRRNKGVHISTVTLVVASLAIVGVAYAIMYQQQVAAPLRQKLADQNAILTRMTGLMNPHANNLLSPSYADANGDLVADAPTDPAKQLDPPALRFSYLAVDDAQPFKESFAALTDAIAKATGKPVEYVPFSDAKDELAAIRDGKLDIAGFNTGSVPIAVCAAGFVPVAEMAGPSGEAGYQMEIIVTRDSPIQKLADLRGHELTLTEPTSNSGYKAPLVLMRENGMKPPDDYLLRYSQGHVESIRGIKNKRFEAAAVANDVLKREIAAGVIGANDYRSIYKGESSFPGAALGYASRLKPELAKKISDVLLHFDWKGTGLEKEFGPEGKTHFIAVDYKKDWEYVRRIDENIGFTYSIAPLAAPATQPQ